MKTRTNLILLAVAVLALAALSGTANAGEMFWNHSSGNWSESKWSSETEPLYILPWVNGESPTFFGTAGTVTVDIPVTVGGFGIGFDVGGYTLSGGTITMTGTGILLNTLAGVTTISSELAGSVGFQKKGGFTMILSGTNTYTGVTTINAGTLSIGSIQNAGVNSPIGAYASAGAAGIVFSATSTLKYTGVTAATNRGVTANRNATIDVPAGVTMTLGACTVGQGTNGNLTAAGGGTTSLGAVTMGGSRSLNTTTGKLTVASLAMVTYSVIFDTSSGTAANGITITGIVSGSGNVTKTGDTAGYLTLQGANTYTGQTILQRGFLNVTSLNSVAGGSASSSLGAPITVPNGTIKMGTVASATPVATLVYTGTGEITDRVIDLAGTTAGATLDQSGTGLLKFTSWTGTANTFTATGAGAKTLTLQGSTAGKGEIAAAIVDNSTTNKTSLTKAGTGTWILTGANTYTGATAVNVGTLLVNSPGSLAAGSAVTVGASGTLGGSGTINGTVTVNAGGTLAPGASLGTLKVGATTISGTFLVDVGALGASDLLAVTGDLTLSGTSILSIVDPNQLIAGFDYAIATYTGNLGGTGAFGSTPNLPKGWYVDYGSKTPKTILLVPEPATMALLALGGLGLLLRRKRR